MESWAPDDKYVARVTPSQQISVYESPSMALHGKKSIKVEGVGAHKEKDREDADKDAKSALGKSGSKASKQARENILAFWTPEVGNQPARVTLLDFPTRSILCQKNLFRVAEVCHNNLAAPQFIRLTMSRSVSFTGKTKAIFSALR